MRSNSHNSYTYTYTYIKQSLHIQYIFPYFFKWEGNHAVRRWVWREDLGLQKRTWNLWPSSLAMAMNAGDKSPSFLVYKKKPGLKKPLKTLKTSLSLFWSPHVFTLTFLSAYKPNPNFIAICKLTLTLIISCVYDDFWCIQKILNPNLHLYF